MRLPPKATGKPKGAMVTQRNRYLAYHYWAMEFGITAQDVALHCGPFHHTAPFTFTLTQLFMGGEVVLLDAFDAAAAVTAIKGHNVSWSFMVPFMLERLLETSIDATAAPGLRMLISGASPLSTRTKERVMATFPHVALHEFYGATEAGVVTNLRPEDQSRKQRCVGQPVAEIEIEIRNEAGQGILPTGQVGDIRMRGPTLFAGYFQAPAKTAEVSDGQWCTLGDIGYIDSEGFLFLVDRRKDVIKSGGGEHLPARDRRSHLARAGGTRVCGRGTGRRALGRGDERLPGPSTRYGRSSGDAAGAKVVPIVARRLQAAEASPLHRRTPPQRQWKGAQARTPHFSVN